MLGHPPFPHLTSRDPVLREEAPARVGGGQVEAGRVAEAGFATWGSGGINHVYKRYFGLSLLLFIFPSALGRRA